MCPVGPNELANELACVRDDAIALGDDDADHDRVAVGADHDGAEDEGEQRMWLCV